MTSQNMVEYVSVSIYCIRCVSLQSVSVCAAVKVGGMAHLALDLATTPHMAVDQARATTQVSSIKPNS